MLSWRNIIEHNLIADKTNLYEVDDELLERQEQFIDTGLKAIVGEDDEKAEERGYSPFIPRTSID